MHIQSLAVTGWLLAASLPALAHHGWSWAESDQSEVSGTIREIYIGPPHPRLQIDTADGPWTVELGNPNQTQRAGFVEGVAKAGDTVTVLGNKPAEGNEKRIKAVKITVSDKEYVFYPERLKQ